MIGSHAIGGVSVVVPARVAHLLWRRLGLQRVQESIYGIDPEAHAVLSDWKSVSLIYEEALLAQKDSQFANHAPMDTADVAARADVSDSAVRLAAREGRLVGAKTPAGWAFQPQAVAEWIAKRADR